MAFSLSKSLFARMTSSSSAVAQETLSDVHEGSFSHVMNKDLYRQRNKIVDDDYLQDREPFPLISGESIEYIGFLYDDHIVAVSNYRLFATGPNGFYSVPLGVIEGLELQTSKDTVLVVCKDARTFRLFFSSIPKCRAWYDRLMECKRRVHKDTKSLFAFIYRAYRKDEKLSQMWRTSKADGIPLSNVSEFEGSGGVRPPLLSLKSDPSTWREEVMTSEYRRMGMCPVQNGNETRVWRITQCNDKYEVCGTYPKLFVVPSLLSDEDLVLAAKFRMSGRLPVVSWRHQTNGCVMVRSSQPLVGVLGWRSPDDERLLLAYSQSCALTSVQQANEVKQNGGPTACMASNLTSNNVKKWGVASLLRDESDEFFSDSDEEGVPHYDSEDDVRGLPKLKVFDLRSYTAALGNRAKGGGCECTDYYPNCEVYYKGLPNIHTIRKSFQQLRNILNVDDQANYLSNLESTQWLSYLSQLLSVACEIVGVVNDGHAPSPVLVHCSDGWDRTTQVITLAELMLDPYYRTLQGFKVLVEREWVGFGHRFSDRCGHTSEDMNQRSPIFLQWLDCVYQLLRQHPCDFQFNENFLVKLGQHSYSCLYGTFLCNSMQDREEDRVAEDTSPVWSILHEDNVEVVNYLYTGESSERVICPVTQIKYMLLWKEMYTHPLLTPYHTPLALDTPTCGRGISSPSPLLVVNSPPTQPVTIPISDLPLSQSNPSPCPASLDATSNADGKNISPDSNTLGNVEHLSDSQELTRTSTSNNSLKSSETNVVSESKKSTDSQELTTNDVMVDNVSPCNSSSKASQIQDVPTLNPSQPMVTENNSNENHLEKEVCSSNDSKTLDRECSESHESLHGVALTHLDEEDKETMVGPNDDQLSEELVSSKANGHVVGGRESENSNKRTFSTVVKQTPFQNSLENLSSNSKNNSPPVDRPLILSTKQNGINSNSSSSLSPSAGSTKCDSGLLNDAITDLSPHKALRPHPQENSGQPSTKPGISLRLGVDGLPLTSSEVQQRVRRLLVERQRELERLRLQLRETQLLVHKQRVDNVTVVEGGAREGGNDMTVEEKIASALDDQSPSSLSSWDCVDHEEGAGMRWVPDHAVTHCQGCGTEFWAGWRKHHCRSCGGVFCSSCSNFYCPVQHEQLFDEVRVCEKCFYKLDGHLRTRDPRKISPM